MERFKTLPIALAAAFMAIAGVSLAAQPVQDSSKSPLKIKPVPETVRPMPFPLNSGPLETARSIEFRSVDQMTEKDRALEADAEATFGEKAGFADLGFNEGKWSYRQLVCPALPNHLFLRFTRNNGTGDVSVFSASVPRGGEGRVRIIPIQRRGYSLFSPAPINALTLSAFNHIRAEEHSEEAPGWLGTGLCYAALAGATPQAAPPDQMSGSGKLSAASSPVLEIPNRGGAIIRFTDMAPLQRPMEWSMTFNGKGKLLKATHSPAPLSKEQQVPPAPAEQQAKPVAASPVDPGR
jgi:hypothetical protein